MNLHLAEISRAVAPDAHAVLIIDQTGWHTTKELDLPCNISIIALPARCPELNPVENIWQYMRDNWLSNLIFKSYDDVVSQCCAVWNKLVQQPPPSPRSVCELGTWVLVSGIWYQTRRQAAGRQTALTKP